MDETLACAEQGSSWLVGPEDEIVQLVFQLVAQLTAYLSRAVAEFGVTEPQAVLIRQLREPLPMRSAAERLHCDASNLTGIVDRLEARGLVERRSVAIDRRVKELVLTEAGRNLQEQLDQLMGVIPGLSDLSAGEQQTLTHLLGRALVTRADSAEEPAAPVEGSG